MKDILAEICERKRSHVEERKRHLPLKEIQSRLQDVDPARDFFGSLQAKAARNEIALIAEIKKASPSRGVIRGDFDPATLARNYALAGATCLSVLTDAPYFQGSDTFLAMAREACHLPLLRKDFMLDAYQVYESRLLGADCILLIMAALTDAEAAEYESIAQLLGMSVLVEVHDEEELGRALSLRSPLLGINNRNLKTLEINLETSERLRRLIPEGKIAVCESGLSNYADVQRMMRQDIFCFLVGESLMREPDVTLATRRLLGETL